MVSGLACRFPKNGKILETMVPANSRSDVNQNTSALPIGTERGILIELVRGCVSRQTLGQYANPSSQAPCEAYYLTEIWQNGPTKSRSVNSRWSPS